MGWEDATIAFDAKRLALPLTLCCGRIRNFAQNGESMASIKGGIEALRAVLDKVDRVHGELSEEKKQVRGNAHPTRKKRGTVLWSAVWSCNGARCDDTSRARAYATR